MVQLDGWEQPEPLCLVTCRGVETEGAANADVKKLAHAAELLRYTEVARPCTVLLLPLLRAPPDHMPACPDKPDATAGTPLFHAVVACRLSCDGRKGVGARCGTMRRGTGGDAKGGGSRC